MIAAANRGSGRWWEDGFRRHRPGYRVRGERLVLCRSWQNGFKFNIVLIVDVSASSSFKCAIKRDAACLGYLLVYIFLQ